MDAVNITIDKTYCTSHSEFIPGEYVQLAISDNGCGMDKKILSHLFEPFFTTKGIGKGTELSFPTVYGIFKQNNGFINVYSEPGRERLLGYFHPGTWVKPIGLCRNVHMG